MDVQTALAVRNAVESSEAEARELLKTNKALAAQLAEASNALKNSQQVRGWGAGVGCGGGVRGWGAGVGCGGGKQ
jgi:hypothetical protein